MAFSRAVVLAAAVAAAVVAAPAAAQPTPPLPAFREALEALYTNTHGDSWTRNDNWMKTADYCTWYGVQCPIHNHTIIDGIVLIANNLTGTLPTLFPQITTLKVLDLSRNAIKGPVPSNFPEIVPLQLVNLQENQLSGPLPAEIANIKTNFPSLKEINLYSNKLSGTIPPTMFGPATLPPFHPRFNLQVFDLHDNMLTGPIPDRVPNANLMTTFMVNENQMTGAIPDSIDSWLEGLKYCSLGGNSWTCPVPSAISDKCQAYCK